MRGFSDSRDVSLGLTRPDGSFAGWTVLTGGNGSGKTSLLRAVALTIGGPGIARNLVTDFAGWVSFGTPQAVAAVRLAVDADHDRFGAGRPFWAGLRWEAPPEDLFGVQRQPSVGEATFGSEARVITGHADETVVRRYERLRDLLTSSPTARVDELAARLAPEAGQPRP